MEQTSKVVDCIENQPSLHMIVTMEGCGHCVDQIKTLAGKHEYVEVPQKILKSVIKLLKTNKDPVVQQLYEKLREISGFPAHVWKLPCGCAMSDMGNIPLGRLLDIPRTHACDNKMPRTVVSALELPSHIGGVRHARK